MEKTDTSIISLFHKYESDLYKDSLLGNTYEDLNMEDFFHAVNYTSSCVGEQYLYHILHHDKCTVTEQQEPLLGKMKGEESFRKRIIELLGKLNHTDAYYLSSLFYKPFPIAPAWEIRLLYVCRFIPLLLGGLFFISQNTLLLIVCILSIVGNTVLHYRNKMKIQEYCFAIPQLIKLIQITETLAQEKELSGVHNGIHQTLERLKCTKRPLASFKLSIYLQSDMAIIAYMFTEIFNILFLLEAYRINQAFVLLKDKREDIKRAFCFVGMVDTLCSISLLRESLPFYCLPQERERANSLTIQKAFHPLIKDCVSNSLTLSNKSMLITGSNMSGKTSFVRIVGINLLSAKILHTCFAKTFCYPRGMRIASSIHITDSLINGKSFFLQEVELLKEILHISSEGNYLILIDEPFKGTNTQERIAIGKAVLAALAQNENIVIASTHDLELGTLLSSLYESYYFCETVKDNLLSFDYTLKKGIATERNAIKILEIYQYPEEIVREAYWSCLPENTGRRISKRKSSDQ